MGKERMEMDEGEMPGVRKETPEEETYNSYGGVERKVGINDLAARNTFIRVLQSEVPNRRSAYKWQVCLYQENEPLKAGNAKTESYRDSV